MSESTIRSVVGSGLAALPWCCIAPAAFALSGVASAGVGTALESATPLFLIASVAFLARGLYLAQVERRGPWWVRAVVWVSAPLVGALWAFRLGWWPG